MHARMYFVFPPDPVANPEGWRSVEILLDLGDYRLDEQETSLWLDNFGPVVVEDGQRHLVFLSEPLHGADAYWEVTDDQITLKEDILTDISRLVSVFQALRRVTILASSRY